MTEKEYTLDDVYVSLSDHYKSAVDPQKIMEKSVLSEGFHAKHKLPFEMYNPSKYKKKQEIKRKLPAEVRRDLNVLKMRSALDTKRFYKRNVMKGAGKNVQLGTVVDSPIDFYHSRLPNKARKATLVDELLADAKFKKGIKKRYVEIIEQKKFKYKKEYKYHKKLQKKRSHK